MSKYTVPSYHLTTLSSTVVVVESNPFLRFNPLKTPIVGTKMINILRDKNTSSCHPSSR